MDQVTAHLGKEHYATKLETRGLALIADEPEAIGGTNLGFTPNELLCSSLAACTSITLRMYADKKDWPLENLEVKVSLVINAETKSVEFNREISLSGYINEEQKQRMLQIANVCPVHKILSSTLTINTQLK